MIRVLFDVLTPKQALLFWAVGKELKERGIEVSYVGRRYAQLDWVERALGIELKPLGEFGGGTLEGKLLASTERQRLLAEEVIASRPDVTVSSGSVELCRVSYGLGIRHVLVSDSPHSPVNRIAVPLSDLIATPAFIPLAEWRRWCIQNVRVLRYRALDPVAWMRRLGDLTANGQAPEGDYFLVRPTEHMASYSLGRGLAETLSVVEGLLSFSDAKVVVLARYPEDVAELRRLYDPRVEVVAEPRLALPLISRALAVFSGGGTMAQEAALLGVPVFSYYPGELPAVHRFLVRRGLLSVLSDLSRESIGRAVAAAADRRFRRRLAERARRLRESMEDPAVVVAEAIANLAGRR